MPFLPETQNTNHATNKCQGEFRTLLWNSVNETLFSILRIGDVPASNQYMQFGVVLHAMGLLGRGEVNLLALNHVRACLVPAYHELVRGE